MMSRRGENCCWTDTIFLMNVFWSMRTSMLRNMMYQSGYEDVFVLDG